MGVGAGNNIQADDTIAIGTNSQASADNAIAMGLNSRATGPNALAIGQGAVATGSIAMGTQASAANGGAAFGDFASATGTNSTAVGPNTTVVHKNAAAFGNGAATTRDNQQVFGTASNTYTTPGIASKASKAAQGTPTHIVTSNAVGDLAARTASELGLATQSDVAGLQSNINRLGNRDKELTEGIATAAALAQPILRSGQHFGMTAGWGGFDGANAVGFSAAGVLADDLIRPGSGTVALYGGIGTGLNEGVVTARAGASFGW
jgi:trimeric autotransporter adhesin